MSIKRTLSLVGVSAVLAISAVSVALAAPGDFALSQRGGGGHPGPMDRMMSPAPFIGIAFERVEGGVKVIQVLEGSPAEIAGLLVDDVITAIGGKTIGNGDVRQALREYRAGDPLELTVTRGEETLAITVTLGEDVTPLRDGLRLRGQARIGAVLEGDTLTVKDVLADSPASTAGLLVGDTITAINGTAVTTRAEVLTALHDAHTAADSEEVTVTITVTRDGASVDLTATLATKLDRLPRLGGMGAMHGMRGMFLQPREDGSGFDMVLPFTLSEGAELTAEAQAAIAGLGWTVQPKEGEDGVYELIIPAESIRDGMSLDALEGIEGFEGALDAFAFGMPGGRGMHFKFAIPDGIVVPVAPAGIEL
jgi:membrane-associated protease RseP (regulator of RpoE activity)